MQGARRSMDTCSLPQTASESNMRSSEPPAGGTYSCGCRPCSRSSSPPPSTWSCASVVSAWARAVRRHRGKQNSRLGDDALGERPVQGQESGGKPAISPAVVHLREGTTFPAMLHLCHLVLSILVLNSKSVSSRCLSSRNRHKLSFFRQVGRPATLTRS